MQNSIVNWQDLRPRERMEHLLKTGHLSDCSFVVYDNNGQKVVLKCHKFVLMSVSPVFERMFEGEFKEAKISNNIVLDDVTDVEFRKFIEYLYWHDNDRLETYDLQTLQALIYLSKKFIITFFTNNCLNVIKRRLSSGLEADVTVDLYEYGHQIEDNEIIAIIQSKFFNKPEACMECAAVLDLCPEVFLKFIEDLGSHARDKDRFSLIERYCKKIGFIKSSAPCETDIDEDFYGIAEFENNVSSHSSMSKEDNTKMGACASTDKETEKQRDADENYQKLREKNAEYIENLLKTIKFTSMSPYEFCAGPGASDLLSIEKKYELLSAICIAESKHRLLSIHQQKLF